MNLPDYYDEMRETAVRKLAGGAPELDALIDSGQDTRRGITLLARPPARVTEIIAQVLADFQSSEPTQYYYPATDIHLTILSIISCYSGFELSAVDPEQYKSLTRTIVRHTPPFNITFSGLTASAGGIVVQGFPQGSGLQSLRDEIRTAFRASGLQQSIDRRYNIQTAHSTVMRFRNSPLDTSRLLKNIEKYRHYFIGTFAVSTVELVYNDWYQRTANAVLLEKYNLVAG